MDENLSVGIEQTYKNEKLLRWISFVLGCLLTIGILSIDGGKRVSRYSDDYRYTYETIDYLNIIEKTYSNKLFKELVKDFIDVDWSYHKQLRDEYFIEKSKLKNKLERERQESIKEFEKDYEEMTEKVLNKKLDLLRDISFGNKTWDSYKSSGVKKEKDLLSSLKMKIREIKRSRIKDISVDSENLQLISKKNRRELWTQSKLEDGRDNISYVIWYLSLIFGFFLSWLYKDKRSNLMVTLGFNVIGFAQKSLLGLWITSKKMKFRKQIKEGGGSSRSNSLLGLWIESKKTKLRTQIKEENDE